ncbi:hypothetical protein CJ030_MR2G024687 [Morella rubra]|uniref:Uncharacterized protein n=1 Tax=Morella rubra TaxID=262757 RepID=A0A6A1WLF5_9ROSI|nr:hypothetical protein CJ030_MR2G024687 [Morella rubra]
MEDPEASPDQFNLCVCQRSEVKSVEACKNFRESKDSFDGTVSLGPITPESAKEIGDVSIDSKSPVTLLDKVASFESNSDSDKVPFGCFNDTSPRTPEDGVFDPFAPGPDDIALAPLGNKCHHEFKGIIPRRLNFDFSSVEAVAVEAGAQSLSDEEMFEAVYENLLEAIVSKQAEVLHSGISGVDSDSDGCKTPPLAPLLNGVADTCPGAPVKSSGKSRDIDLGLCRKLF